MNRPAWMLVLLLVLSSAGWWLATRGAPALANDVLPTRDVAGELEIALARIALLEARPEVVRPSDTRTPAAPSSGELGVEPDSDPEVDAREERVRDILDPWWRGALQIDDALRRASALADIRAALLSEDPAVVEAALRAFVAVRELDFDRAAFRPLVQALLESEDARVRAEALRAWMGFLDERTDLPLILGRLEDPAPDVRSWAARMLGSFEGPEVDSIALRLLDDPDPRVRTAVLWRVTPEQMDGPLGRHLLELCADPVQRDEIVDRCFSHLREKNPAVIERIIESVREGGDSGAVRARMSLNHGVPEASRARVASAFLEILAGATASFVRSSALSVVRAHGDASHLPELEALAANPLATERLRREARAAIAQIRARTGG